MTKKRIFRLMCAAAIVIAMTACNKDNDKGKSVSVYVVATKSEYVENYELAVSGKPRVWVNGFQNPGLVGNAEWGAAHDVFVSGYNVYIVGFSFDLEYSSSTGSLRQRNTHGVLWTNGIPTILPTEGIPTFDEREHSTFPYAVFVENGDVYVAGHYASSYSSRDGGVLVYWKNGVLQKVVDNNPLTRAIVKDMFVYNDVTYIVGYTRTFDDNYRPIADRAVLWVDGEEHSLHFTTPIQNSHAENIFIENGEIYISGNLRNSANSSAGYSEFGYPQIWCGNTTDLQFQYVGVNTDDRMAARGICAHKGVWHQLLQAGEQYGGYRSGTTNYYNGVPWAEQQDFIRICSGNGISVECMTIYDGNVYIAAKEHGDKGSSWIYDVYFPAVWGPKGWETYSSDMSYIEIHGIAVGQ